MMNERLKEWIARKKMMMSKKTRQVSGNFYKPETSCGTKYVLNAAYMFYFKENTDICN